MVRSALVLTGCSGIICNGCLFAIIEIHIFPQGELRVLSERQCLRRMQRKEQSTLEITSQTNEKITMYATTWCGDCRMAKRWFDAHGVAYDYINIEENEEAAETVTRLNGGMRSVPTIVFPDGSVLVEPSPRQ